MVHQNQRLLLNLVKQRQNFAWCFIAITILVTSSLTEKRALSLASNKNVNFSIQFCEGRIFNKFDAIDSREVFLEVNGYDLPGDCNASSKSDILNNCKCKNYLLYY